MTGKFLPPQWIRLLLAGSLLAAGASLTAQVGPATTDNPGARETAPSEAARASDESDTAAAAESGAGPGDAPDTETASAANGPRRVYVIPLEGVVAKPQIYIIRRALKEAEAGGADTILLRLNTPGGASNVMTELMDMLMRFEGKTIAFVDNEAISAGSFIASVCNEIYFAPTGIMGSAAAINADGSDIPETLKDKLYSYLDAKIRAAGSNARYRQEVQRAMMDADYVLEIEGRVISPEGDLLTLTADEAVVKYGEPPAPLLAKGIAEDVEGVLAQEYGEGNFTITNFEVGGAEQVAKWMNGIAPILLTLGILLLYFEAQTPSFGIFGAMGLFLIVVFFGSNYVAGLAGYEVIAVFVVGLLLIAVEFFLLPGTLIPGILGALMVFGSLFWAMVDYWPSDGVNVPLNALTEPALNMLMSGFLLVLGMLLMARIMPHTPLYRQLVLKSAVGSSRFDGSQEIGETQAEEQPPVGASGVAVVPLRPSGQVEIDGKRYPASVAFGNVERDSEIEVVGRRDFGLLVKQKS